MTPGEDRRARDALRAAWRTAGVYPDLTVGEAIARGCTAHAGDQIVFARVHGDTTTVTLGELLERAGACAERLSGAGVGAGDPVVVQAPADLSGTEVLAAVWLLGAVAVPIATTASTDEVAQAVHQCGAVRVVVAPEWRGRDLVTPLVSEGEALGLHRVIVLGSEAVDGALPLASIGPAPVPTGRRGQPPSSVACVLYTSGSTAAPKGVQHSHETLLCGLTAVPSDATSRMLGTFPSGHVASLLGLLRPLAAGGTTVVMDRWSAGAAAELVEQQSITTSAGTPFFLSTLLDEAERSGRDISSLNRFLCGASAVPPALVSRSEAAGIVTWRTYGSTEHPAISSGGPTDPPEKRRLTDGRVTPGNEVRLLDESDADVAAGEEGEIVARGPKQFLGYQDPAPDAEAFVDGTWFRTGDLARFDEDGYLVVTDRVKDIIIRGGENISAREVEEVLARHPGVAEVAVCAAPDEVWGEAVCAVVVPQDGAMAPTIQDLGEAATAAGLATHKLPARVVVTDSLPRTAAGKVRKRDLRSLL
ncbi:MAG: class I adenylate-forming enzyme family protein [Acidimicrobiales bacterium]